MLFYHRLKMHHSCASPDPTPTDGEVPTIVCAGRRRPPVGFAYAHAFHDHDKRKRRAEGDGDLGGRAGRELAEQTAWGTSGIRVRELD